MIGDTHVSAVTQAALLEVDDLESQGIETVVVAAPDLQGRLFGRRMPRDAFRERPEGVDVCTCTLAWDMEQDLEVPGVAFAGFHNGWPDFRLVPDLSTLRPLGWLDGVAICFADIVDQDGQPVDIAPRNLLQAQLRRLRDAGYEAYIGSELEFYLYRNDPDAARRMQYRDLAPTTSAHVDYLISPGNLMEPFFRRVAHGLARSGITMETAQNEWGHGQWELGVRYDAALRTADAHTLFKLAIKELAAREGMVATFMARPSTESIGSSGHVHLSLRDRAGGFPFYDGEADHRLSHLFRSAVGGLLTHASDLMLWYAPNVNSYRRVSRDELVAGAGATWGYDNRTVSVRTLGSSPSSLHLEFRLPGADVNPYLAFAGMIASVTAGIEGGIDPGPPLEGNAYAQDRAPLPAHLAEASAAFRRSESTRRWFGDRVVDHYAAMADHEWSSFTNVVTEWEIARYFEQA